MPTAVPSGGDHGRGLAGEARHATTGGGGTRGSHPRVCLDSHVRMSYWERVVADGYRVPHGAALSELTTDLVTMLGDPDRRVREDIAFSILSTWTREGIYDDLLSGLGDGLLVGLRHGIGEAGTESVIRRTLSAMALTEVVRRDNATQTLPPATLLTWADRSVGWYVDERDLRADVPGAGEVGALAHGADLVGTLAASRHLGSDELTVMLDVIAERLLIPTDHVVSQDEADRLAFATMSLLHRDLVTSDIIESWLDRLAGSWRRGDEIRNGDGVPHGDRSQRTDTQSRPDGARARNGPGRYAARAGSDESVRANCIAYARSLHLQLILGVDGTPTQQIIGRPGASPTARPDMLIALQRQLRSSNPSMFRP
jgi:hypothetical protein